MRYEILQSIVWNRCRLIDSRYEQPLYVLLLPILICHKHVIMHETGCQSPPRPGLLSHLAQALNPMRAGSFCALSFDRHLLTAAPPQVAFVQDTQGWVSGRVTFVGPTPEYLAQFQNRHAP